MKKFTILLMVVAVALVPVAAFSQENTTPQEEYIQNDSLLTDLISEYSALMQDREDNIEYFENRRINYKNIFYYAQSMASVENGIKQVDWSIESAYAAVKSREAQLEISFRNSFVNLFLKKQSIENALSYKAEAEAYYSETLKNHQLGFISPLELMEAEYQAKSAANSYLSKQRSYLDSLRSFNVIMGKELEYDDYSYDFNEGPSVLADLSLYMESALYNSENLKKIRQAIDKYQTESSHLDKYNISENFSYVKEKIESLDINLNIQALTLEQLEYTVAKSIESKYKSLLIERDKLFLEELNIAILEEDYKISRALFNSGYIDNAELLESKENYINAQEAHIISIYSYNTQVKSLEFDCACYLEEDDIV